MWAWYFYVNIYDSTLVFYRGGDKTSPVSTCDEFRRLNTSTSLFLGGNNRLISYLMLKNVQYKTAVCDLAFRNLYATSLDFGQVYESFLKTNRPVFIRQDQESLNTNLAYVSLTSYNIDLDSRILNPNIFANLKQATIFGRLSSIQPDLFVSFKRLQSIKIDYVNFIGIVRRQGIEWIRGINHGVKVDLNNDSSIQLARDRISIIYIDFSTDMVINMGITLFPDRLFCSFVSWPFEQLTFVEFFSNELANRTFTCLTFWLFQHHQRVHASTHIFGFFPQMNFSHGCKNFTRRVSSSCQKKNYQKLNFNSLDFLLFSEFLLIAASPLVSLLGLILNVLTIVCIVQKAFKKEFQQKQYTYILIYSVSSSLVCFFQLVSLVNECQQPFGLICSSIRRFLSVQYIKLIVGEFFTHVCITVSNLTYVWFALCRLSLVGNKHGKIVRFAAEVGVKKLMFVFLILSTGLALVKPFRYTIDNLVPYSLGQTEFPILFYKNSNLPTIRISKFKLKFIGNVVYDFVNYFVFILANMAIDLIMLKKVRKVMREKEEKMSEQIAATREKLEKENALAFKKLVKLVLVNSLVGICLRMPSCVTSLNDFRLVLSGFVDVKFFTAHSFVSNVFAFPYTLGYLCALAKVCEVFNTLGRLMYVVSLSTNFFLMKRFDRNFRAAFEAVFVKKNQQHRKQ